MTTLLKRKRTMNSQPSLTYHDLGSGVLAFSTTRNGGCGEGNYASGNINPYCGDSPLNVSRNLSALAEELGIDTGHIVLPHQTHGTAVLRISDDFFLRPLSERKKALEGIDAVMTDVRGVCVGVSTADCVPILLYDPEHHAVCAVHAGWRGTVGRIVEKAVSAMREQYSTEPQSLVACIAPAISAERFEVGDEVYDEFQAATFDMRRISFRAGKWHIDLPECNRLQLSEAGVSPANIHLCGICTYSNAERYFSARRLGAQCGRIYNGIMLPEF